MTEGAPPALATWEDVQGRWRPLSSAEQETATTRIAEASALLRREIPDIATRAGDDPDLAVLVVAKVADAVIEAMVNPERAKTLQETIGNRSFATGFDTSGPSGVFFTDDELAPLQPKPPTSTPAGAASLGIGTATVGIAPGWAPPSRHRRHSWGLDHPW